MSTETTTDPKSAPLLAQAVELVVANTHTVINETELLRDFFTRLEGTTPKPVGDKEPRGDVPDSEGSARQLIRVLEELTVEVNELHALVLRLEEVT